MGMKGGKWMIHPDMELLEEEDETARILPIYNKTTEMTVGAMRRLVHGALRRISISFLTRSPRK